MLEPNKRVAYPSDLSDEEWEIIRPYIPTPLTNRGKKRVHCYRELLNAIFYLLRSGCAWRLLPHDFPPWKTVYHYFRIWRLNGTWEEMNAALRTDLRVAYGKKSEPSQALIYAAMIHLMVRRLGRIKTER
jgi:putative transposase